MVQELTTERQFAIALPHWHQTMKIMNSYERMNPLSCEPMHGQKQIRSDRHAFFACLQQGQEIKFQPYLSRIDESNESFYTGDQCPENGETNHRLWIIG